MKWVKWRSHTIDIHICMLLLFKNQFINVPSAGIILGYFFVAWRACSSADSCGPGYRGASFRGREPWEGGLNLAGFSRTRGFGARGVDFFDNGLEAFFEACRTFCGAAKRERQIELPWGSKKRGIGVVGGILTDRDVELVAGALSMQRRAFGGVE
jgi:hypothetical protein